MVKKTRNREDVARTAHRVVGATIARTESPTVEVEPAEPRRVRFVSHFQEIHPSPTEGARTTK